MSTRKAENKIGKRPPLHGGKSLSPLLRRNEKVTERDIDDCSSDGEQNRPSEEEENSYEYQQESTTYTDTTSDRSQLPYERFYISGSVPRTPELPTVETRRPNSENQQKSSTLNDQSSSVYNKRWVLFGTIAVLVLAMNYSGIFSLKNEIKTCSFEKFRNIQPQQPERVWQTISTGIELVINRKIRSPGVYLFVHRGNREINKLILGIAEHASKCFSHSMRPVQMESSDFTSSFAIEDYGYAIEKFKTKIKEGSVILILNLNGIPAEAARALHAICDTHSPIVEDVVIFLTLTADGSETTDNPVRLATDTLEHLWGSKLKRNELDPLITRVTDQVVLLQN